MDLSPFPLWTSAEGNKQRCSARATLGWTWTNGETRGVLCHQQPPLAIAFLTSPMMEEGMPPPGLFCYFCCSSECVIAKQRGQVCRCERKAGQPPISPDFLNNRLQIQHFCSLWLVPSFYKARHFCGGHWDGKAGHNR